MAYQGKTVWQHNDIVTEEDMNRIEQGIEDISDRATSTGMVINDHIQNTNVHITPTDRMVWNSKETPAGAQEKVDAVQSNLNAHVGDNVRHITAVERSNWNAAEQKAIDWAKSFGLGSGAFFVGDLNSIPINSDTGFYTTNGQTANTPPGVNANGAVIHIARDHRPSQMYINYIANRVFVRGYTGSGWNNWEEIEKVSGAQAKANQAENNARNASVNKIAVYTGNGIDPNTTQDAYILTNHSNTPDSGHWHINTFFYASTINNRGQIALRYNGEDEMYIRKFNNGWSTWRRVWHSGNSTASLNSSGYQRLATGLIIQWGRASAVSQSTISFPLAFPNECFQVVVTPYQNYDPTFVYAVTRNGFEVQRNNSNNVFVNYIAVGR